jgi:two-component system LytT family response regulator
MQPLSIVIIAGEPSLRDTLCQYVKQIGIDRIVGVEDTLTREGPVDGPAPHLMILAADFSDDAVLAVLRQHKDPSNPQIICVSWSEHGAAHAFEARVADFLIRPVSQVRFEEALHRVRERVCMAGLFEHRDKLVALLQGSAPEAGVSGAAPPRVRPVRPNGSPVDRLVLRQGNRVRFVEARHITWIEADDTYVRLHEGPRSHLINERLKNVAARLNRRQFVRIHRSTIVNLERIKEIRPHPGGGAIVVLQEGTELKMSRSYYRRLDKLLAGLPSKMRLF